MSIRKIVRILDFPEDIRESLWYKEGAGAWTQNPTQIRLDPGTHKVLLKKDALKDYTVSSGPIIVRRPVTSPRACRKWLKFEEISVKPTGTSIFHLIYDENVDVWYWTGSAWENRGADLDPPWNTEAEINDNIASLAITGPLRSIGVMSWLQTTDRQITPELEAVKLLMEADINFQESWLLRALIPALRTIRFQADLKVKMMATDSSLDLSGVGLGDLQVRDCVTGYDETTDPEYIDNIVTGYDEGTMVISFSGAVSEDNVVLVRLDCEPEVNITTGQDYNELAKIPCLVLEDLSLDESLEGFRGEDIKDKIAGTAWQMGSPKSEAWTFLLRGITDGLVDQLRLAEGVKTFFASTPMLHWPDLDLYLGLTPTREYTSSYRPNASDMLAGEMDFRVNWVPNYPAAGEERDLVEIFHTGLNKI